MFTVRMKNEFSDCDFKCFEKTRVGATSRCYQIPTLFVIIGDVTEEFLVEIDMVMPLYNFDLKVTHNPPKKTKTYSNSLIRSLLECDKIKSALHRASQNILVQYHHEGHNAGKIQTTRKKPPHEFYPILPNEVGHVGLFHSHEGAGVSAVPVAIFQVALLTTSRSVLR